MSQIIMERKRPAFPQELSEFEKKIAKKCNFRQNLLNSIKKRVILAGSAEKNRCKSHDQQGKRQKTLGFDRLFKYVSQSRASLQKSG